MEQCNSKYGSAFLAYYSEKAEQFKYCILLEDRIYFTNSKRRFKEHYRCSKKRKINGTWMKRRIGYNGRYYYSWWRIRMKGI